SGYNFWAANNETYFTYGKAAVALGCEQPDQQLRFCQEKDEVYQMGQPLGPVESMLEQDRIAWRRGFAFIQQYVRRFAKLTIRKFFEFWSPYPNAVDSTTGQISSTRTFVSFMTYGPLLCLTLLGLLLTLRDWYRYVLVYTYIGTFTFA